MKTTEIKLHRSKSRISASGVRSAPAKIRIKIKDILIPTDFSEASTKALAFASTFAQAIGARLTVVYVVEPMVYTDVAYMPLAMENDRAVETAQSKLERLIAQHHVPAKVLRQALVRTGVPYNEITEAARTLKVDMIIISTHGRTGLARVLLGSTAERVVRHAHCPVLVIR